MLVLLLVTGAPASGKTTLAKRLATDLRLPYLGKDFFKEPLFDSLGWNDRAWSRRLGMASMQLMYRCAEALLQVGQSTVLESNFSPQWDTEPVRTLQQRYACRVVQVLCMAPGSVLFERFQKRAFADELHPGHLARESLEEIRPILLYNPWPALPVDGLLITVDTTDFAALDYAEVLRRCRLAAEQ